MACVQASQIFDKFKANGSFIDMIEKHGINSPQFFLKY